MNIRTKEIGEMFKSKRVEMHLSLKEVENATSIRTNYLQAIEEGNVDKFLTSVYALGFVRQYASFLGFDGDKLIKENDKEMEGVINRVMWKKWLRRRNSKNRMSWERFEEQVERTLALPRPQIIHVF